MRVLFAGSPAIALPSLEAVRASFELVGLLTNPDSRAGRGMAACCTDVALRATALDPALPIFSPERLDAKVREAIAALRPDVLAVFAYGKIFGPKFLSLFPMGGLNVHPSLLPLYRGCAPIASAILDRANETGISLQRVALAMDTGDILLSERLSLNGRETTASLNDWAAVRGAELLVRGLDLLEKGQAIFLPQDSSKASYCRKIEKGDGSLDFGLGAAELDARIRAFTPWPGAFTSLNGKRLLVLEAEPLDPGQSAAWPASASARPGTVLGLDKARGLMVQTGEGLLALTKLQLSGKKALPYREFAHGVRDLEGAILGA